VAAPFAQRAVELRSHLRCGYFCFTQRRNLQEQITPIDIGVIVWQQTERHRGNLPQQFVEPSAQPRKTSARYDTANRASPNC
jgi:hypothetical protein